IGEISLFVCALVVLSIFLIPKISRRTKSVSTGFGGNTETDDYYENIGNRETLSGETSSRETSGSQDSGVSGAQDISGGGTAVSHTHKFGKWSSNKLSHWHECSVCNIIIDETDHVYTDNNDTTCNVCGYTRKLGTSKIKYSTNSSGYNYLTTVESHSEAEANGLKAKIYAEKNTEDIYKITGKKYYINKSTPISDVTSKLQSGEIKSGDAVLFERGGVWRVPYKGWITLPSGVVMGAYGKGEKPRFYGSRRNFADDSLWEKYDTNIYRTYLKSSGNVGNIVFNDIACLGVKKWDLSDVRSNYDFYYSSDEYLYLYYEGDIGNDFNSVEISQRGELINFNSNCIVDNICVRYTGSHGIDGAHGTENVKITNCEVGFIGGSMQSGTTRFGNGIEFPIGAKNITVRNNHVYNCYDAGITFQSWSSANTASHYYNIDFSENLIEKCCYGIEFFTTSGAKGSNRYSDYKNISFHDNVIRFSGYEWSQLQRPDPVMTSHIRGGQWAYVEDCENFTIYNNVFDISRASMIFWWWNNKSFVHPGPHNGLTVKNNTYYQAQTPDKRIITFHNQDPLYATDYSGFRAAVETFDPSPAKTVWLTDLILE
ncbi:MAG: right-handed parallel beta-helix repeat-containing protein, partial [Clostridia bacterium]|nr:right-handed parallel beta-helix repeat-containing protein [Clostridia bacterium]